MTDEDQGYPRTMATDREVLITVLVQSIVRDWVYMGYKLDDPRLQDAWEEIRSCPRLKDVVALGFR